MFISVQSLANAINEKRYLKPEELKPESRKETILTDYIYSCGEKYGWIRLSVCLVTYEIDVHLFGISNPVETVKTDDYNHALHVMNILKNKYNGKEV